MDKDERERLAKLLLQHRESLARELDYRKTHGREYSPGVIDELREAIEYIEQKLAGA